MNYGGKHKVSVPKIEPNDGKVQLHKNFSPVDPDPQKFFPLDLQFKAADDPLAGKSGKDSLSEEEAQLA